MTKRLLLIAALAILTGCTTTGPPRQSQPYDPADAYGDFDTYCDIEGADANDPDCFD